MPASLTEFEISSLISLDIMAMMELTVALEKMYFYLHGYAYAVEFILLIFFNNNFQMTL